MAVYTIGGREVVASLLFAQTYFLGLGRGDTAWDTALVQPSPSDIDLVDKIGVTRTRTQSYATPDTEGEIAMADGSKFTLTGTPTRYLYLLFKLDLADAVPQTLRECGVFHGTVLDGGVPGGQMFIPHASVVNYGKLIEVDRFNSIVRDGTTEQEFSFIITL